MNRAMATSLSSLFVCLTVVVTTSVALSDEPLVSGPRIGERVVSFKVKDCTGPQMGGTLCYQCAYGDRPVVVIFTRRLGDDVISLTKQIDTVVAEHSDQKLAAFVVHLSENPDTAAPRLRKIAETSKLTKTPLTTFATRDGPAGYAISPEADVTVLMWADQKVRASRSFGRDKLSESDIKLVIEDSIKLIKLPSPSAGDPASQ